MTPEQLELRRRLVTASDASAICGVNPWRSVHDVYADKIGEAREFTGNTRTRIGNKLETVILDLAAEEHGLRFQHNKETHIDTVLPWLGATPDGYELEDRPVATVECKTVGFDVAAHWGDDQIPDYVLVQAMVQMHVERLPRARVLALIGTELRVYNVEHNTDLDCAILERLDEFHRKHLEPRVPPAADGSQSASRMLSRLRPSARGLRIEATEAINVLASQVLQMQSEAKRIDKQKKFLEQRIQEMFGDAEVVEGDTYRCTWKWQEPYSVKAHRRAGYRAFRIQEKGKRHGDDE